MIGMHNCIHRDCADCGGHHNPLIACPESGKPGYGIHESDDPGENKSAITTESGLPAEPESGIGGGGERGVSSGTPSGKPGSESPLPSTGDAYLEMKAARDRYQDAAGYECRRAQKAEAERDALRERNEKLTTALQIARGRLASTGKHQRIIEAINDLIGEPEYD